MTDPALAIAAPFVIQFERFVSTPYHGAADRPGVWSIGYGFTRMPDGSPVTSETPAMTLDQADERLNELLADLLVSIRRIVKVKITNHMAAALVSFAYNLGIGDLERSSLMVCLNAGSPARAADRFPEWVYADGVVVPGLVRRRAAERDMALTPDASVEPTTDALNDQELKTIDPDPEQVP